MQLENFHGFSSIDKIDVFIKSSLLVSLVITLLLFRKSTSPCRKELDNLLKLVLDGWFAKIIIYNIIIISEQDLTGSTITHSVFLVHNHHSDSY